MSTQPITIETLEILDTIDRRGSFAKAAEELNKATSALSYAVQKLEDQLDIALFQRQGRRSVLTPAGQLVLEEGRKILLATHLLADQAKELATGWEPRLRIAIESTLNYQKFFQILETFMNDHANLEVDICECILNGGWEALELDRVDLIIGVPGPVPLQKGYRAVPVAPNDLILVVAAHHPVAILANNPDALIQALPETRKIITHDTSTVNVMRSEGLKSGKKTLYVQTMEQKIEAQLAGLGAGHLPRHRIQSHLDNGQLIELHLPKTNKNENFIAWKISNKGKALQALTQLLTIKK